MTLLPVIIFALNATGRHALWWRMMAPSATSNLRMGRYALVYTPNGFCGTRRRQSVLGGRARAYERERYTGYGMVYGLMYRVLARFDRFDPQCALNAYCVCCVLHIL